MAPERLQFIGAGSWLESSDIVLLGLPLDFSASFKAGSRLAPNEIRRYSRNLELYSPYQRRSLRSVRYFDSGDLVFDSDEPKANLARIERAAARLQAGGKRVLALGGEHSVSYPLVQALSRKHPHLAVIHLDAHADLREKYDGSPYSHACVMRRVAEIVSFDSIYQFGIRSGTQAEFELMEEHRTLRGFVSRSGAAMARRIGRRPVYLTVDIDVFDPSLVSGTGTPEAGGIFFQDFLVLLPHLRKMNVVGADLVELAPAIDPSGVSSAVAALLVRELLLLLAPWEKRRISE